MKFAVRDGAAHACCNECTVVVVVDGAEIDICETPSRKWAEVICGALTQAYAEPNTPGIPGNPVKGAKS